MCPHDDSDASEREIVVSRTIEGPRRLVFLAYTDVKHLGQWWGPNGFSITTDSFEFRQGGVWSFIMHGPDGTDYPNHVVWQEIVPLERIVLWHGSHPNDAQAFTSIITFADHGKGTRVTMRGVFPTKERRDEVVLKYGAIEGGQQTLAKLASYVEGGGVSATEDER